MYGKREIVRKYAVFAVVLLVCGILHVVLYRVPYTYSIAELYAMACAIIWGISIQNRITDTRLRRILLGICVSILVYYNLQVLRYHFTGGNEFLSRMFWYAYYLPVISIAVLSFYTGVCAHRLPHSPLGIVSYAPVAIGIVLAVAILTNSLHYQVFAIDGDVMSDSSITYRWAYFVFWAFCATMAVSSLFICWSKLGKARRSPVALLPIGIFAIEALYLVLNFLNREPKFDGIRLWNVGETYGFFAIALFESYIDLGLIPANRGYEKVFSRMTMPATIRNSSGECVYVSAGGTEALVSSDDYELQSHRIRGGSVEWAIDVGHLRRLDSQLSETKESLEAKHELLLREGQVSREKAELEMRNRLYDHVKLAVEPQLKTVGEILSGPDDLRDWLPFVAVIGAYVKRRANLQLLSPDTEPYDELCLAIRESLRYVEHLGVVTAWSSLGTGHIDIDVVIAAYEDFERILEESYESLCSLMVSLRTEGTCLTLRYLLNTTSSVAIPVAPGRPGVQSSVALSQDGDDVIIIATYGLTEVQ